MNEDKVMVKRRIRTRRGKLMSFEDLPINVKEDFIKIKKKLIEYHNKNLEVRVFGSYFHGFWDEFSDYDVIIKESPIFDNTDNKILEDINLKVNVIYTDKPFSDILIP